MKKKKKLTLRQFLLHDNQKLDDLLLYNSMRTQLVNHDRDLNIMYWIKWVASFFQHLLDTERGLHELDSIESQPLNKCCTVNSFQTMAISAVK